MPNANIKNLIPILITVAFLLLGGCSSQEEKRAKSLAQAAQFEAGGHYNDALDVLEVISRKYPDDSEILQRIGLIHQELGNHPEAAFYLGAARNFSPNDQELLLQSYHAHEKAEQSDIAGDLLEVFAQNYPDDMTDSLWFRLGEMRRQAQKPETALEAYLEGVKLTDSKPTAETALIIGTLFKQLDNLPMAARWLVIAVNSDDSEALPALFGILEIQLRSKHWEAAEKTIAVLDKKFPGAVDASEWASARTELKKWRTVQAEAKQQIEKLAQVDPPSKEIPSETPAKLTEAASNPPTTSAPPTKTAIAREPSGKEQVVADMANATALANTPASKAETAKKPEPAAATPETSAQTQPTEPIIVFNPDIIIQPAEPAVEIDDEPAVPNTGELDAGTIDETEDVLAFVIDEAAIQEKQEIFTDYEPVNVYTGSIPQQEPAPEPVESPLDTTLLSLEEIIMKAEEATSNRNYKRAIRLYRGALKLTNDRGAISSALSKVYFADGQATNAATTALEATRLAPENVQYMLEYLRVVQRVKKPSDFIKELEIAYKRFPRSPEIMLSLARGYHRLIGDNAAAVALYRRFIQLAPGHPLHSEAEAELARIR